MAFIRHNPNSAAITIEDNDAVQPPPPPPPLKQIKRTISQEFTFSELWGNPNEEPICCLRPFSVHSPSTSRTRPRSRISTRIAAQFTLTSKRALSSERCSDSNSDDDSCALFTPSGTESESESDIIEAIPTRCRSRGLKSTKQRQHPVSAEVFSKMTVSEKLDVLREEDIDLNPLGAEHWPLDAQPEWQVKKHILMPNMKNVCWLVAGPVIIFSSIVVTYIKFG